MIRGSVQTFEKELEATEFNIMIRVLWSIVRWTFSLISFGQVLLYLPLALDVSTTCLCPSMTRIELTRLTGMLQIAGKEAMLALSLSLSICFGSYATLHLYEKHTSPAQTIGMLISDLFAG